MVRAEAVLCRLRYVRYDNLVFLFSSSLDFVITCLSISVRAQCDSVTNVNIRYQEQHPCVASREVHSWWQYLSEVVIAQAAVVIDDHADLLDVIQLHFSRKAHTLYKKRERRESVVDYQA